MKAKILAGWLLEHPDLEVLMNSMNRTEIKPSITTALYSDIVDKEGNVIVKEDDDFILIEGVEL